MHTVHSRSGSLVQVVGDTGVVAGAAPLVIIREGNADVIELSPDTARSLGLALIEMAALIERQSEER
ncbi:hypothetical protein [Gordonia sp. (in: high G+C Gram-positive bacteria)]|uniref:hypothetical protein n=1 Tax=Gordonia sp. (in: high G+C Gram-positive bacteria) TaxID=84139 RepID=UPI0019951D71|nr:hypothetical protein [Gordonia sp. (in: high G+C Gram-positive bacteria)]MBD0020853.1 hypothetical protein [Gordonia sp. (in: high G+C Gram-positive bacteria)]